MKTHHILVPAIASLTLLVANPASALTPRNAIPGATIEGSRVKILPVKWIYHCRKYRNYHERQRCYEEHGLNYQ